MSFISIVELCTRHSLLITRYDTNRGGENDNNDFRYF